MSDSGHRRVRWLREYVADHPNTGLISPAISDGSTQAVRALQQRLTRSARKVLRRHAPAKVPEYYALLDAVIMFFWGDKGLTAGKMYEVAAIGLPILCIQPESEVRGSLSVTTLARCASIPTSATSTVSGKRPSVAR